MPQLRQKPSASPGRPFRARPTGCSHRGQKRLLSGTCGSARTALAGSWAGTGGISTRPAPRFPRDDLLVLARVPRVPARQAVPADDGNEPLPWLPALTGAGAAAAAIPHTVQYPPSMVPPQPGCVQVAGSPAAAGAATATGAGGGAGAGAAAIPHTVQYPPSMVPPQPGCVQVPTLVVIAAAPARRRPGSPAGSPLRLPTRPPGHTALSRAAPGPPGSAR